MSAIQSQPWTNDLQSKYEKCRNITEEIYKRINITFEIKKLETGEQSDVSVNSADVDSAETDLFACDKTDSLPSSTEAEPAPAHATPKASITKYININNNEEKKAPIYKRPKKKFRKRVKKRQSKPDREGSSDEEVLPVGRAGSPDRTCTVPNIIIVTKGLTPKILNPDKKTKRSPKQKACRETSTSIDFPSKTLKGKSESATAINNTIVNTKNADKVMEEKKYQLEMESKCCSLCGQTFKNERGLRRHLALSHITDQETTRPEREVKPA